MRAAHSGFSSERQPGRVAGGARVADPRAGHLPHAAAEALVGLLAVHLGGERRIGEDARHVDGRPRHRDRARTHLVAALLQGHGHGGGAGATAAAPDRA